MRVCESWNHSRRACLIVTQDKFWLSSIIRHTQHTTKLELFSGAVIRWLVRRSEGRSLSQFGWMFGRVGRLVGWSIINSLVRSFIRSFIQLSFLL